MSEITLSEMTASGLATSPSKREGDQLIRVEGHIGAYVDQGEKNGDSGDADEANDAVHQVSSYRSVGHKFAGIFDLLDHVCRGIGTNTGIDG